MDRLVMRLGLLLGLIACSATEVSVPTVAARPPRAAVTAAEASIPPQGPLGRTGLPIALPTRERARAAAYAIPADHPRPPLGRFKLTAYSGPQLGQARPITATGTSARAGRTVAVDPAIIPLGSRIYIEGIGERIAEDVGGAVKGRHIDVYLSSVPRARRFGVQRGTVTVIAAPRKRG